MNEENVPPMGVTAAKTALRDQVLTARRRRRLDDSARAATSLAEHLLAAEPVRRAATVAAYVSTSSEPGTGALLDALSDAGTRVILPVLLPDGDLDWALYRGPEALVPARLGLLEPAGPRLGVKAVCAADVVLVPGLAVSSTGMRIGRGGGSYDRVLSRVGPDVFTCVLLHQDEIDRPVPFEPHDRPVTAAATPSGIRLFSSRA